MAPASTSKVPSVSVHLDYVTPLTDFVFNIDFLITVSPILTTKTRYEHGADHGSTPGSGHQN